MENTVYQFDVVAKYYMNASDCSWASTSADNYFAVIPLELGKVYKVTCQNITDLTKFQCVQSDSGIIGEVGILAMANDWAIAPNNGTYLSFVATKNYLICTGGRTYGGELSVTCSPLFSVVGTKWKMYSTAKWVRIGSQPYKIDGAFYEGNTVLTELSSDNNIEIGNKSFRCGSQYPAPMVDSYYAAERWRVVKGAYITGSGFPMRDLTDTLYLEITGGEDATNLDLIAWLYGAGELHVMANITYNDATVEMKSGQTATINCAGEIALTDIVITPEFSVKIAYGDIINEAHNGQTATLKCAGKKMKHDIVISTQSLASSIVGTWEFNADASTLTLPSSTLLVYSSVQRTDIFGELKSKSSSSATMLCLGYKDEDTQDMYVGLRSNSNSANLFYGYKLNDGTINTNAISYLNLTGATLTFYEDFADKNTVVDEVFVAWLKANATKQ